MNIKFRPQCFNPLSKIKSPYKVGRYNWIMRAEWTIAGYLHKVHSQLHYLSSHAPYPVRKKWSKIANKFEHRHHKIL